MKNYENTIGKYSIKVHKSARGLEWYGNVFKVVDGIETSIIKQNGWVEFTSRKNAIKILENLPEVKAERFKLQETAKKVERYKTKNKNYQENRKDIYG